MEDRMDTLYLFEFGAVFNPEVCELRGCVDGQKSDLSVQSQHSLIFYFYFLTFERLACPKDVIHNKSTLISPLLNPN